MVLFWYWWRKKTHVGSSPPIFEDIPKLSWAETATQTWKQTPWNCCLMSDESQIALARQTYFFLSFSHFSWEGFIPYGVRGHQTGLAKWGVTTLGDQEDTSLMIIGPPDLIAVPSLPRISPFVVLQNTDIFTGILGLKPVIGIGRSASLSKNVQLIFV